MRMNSPRAKKGWIPKASCKNANVLFVMQKQSQRLASEEEQALQEKKEQELAASITITAKEIDCGDRIKGCCPGKDGICKHCRACLTFLFFCFMILLTLCLDTDNPRDQLCSKAENIYCCVSVSNVDTGITNFIKMITCRNAIRHTQNRKNKAQYYKKKASQTRIAKAAQEEMITSKAAMEYNIRSDQLKCNYLGRGLARLRTNKVCCLPPWTTSSTRKQCKECKYSAQEKIIDENTELY